MIGGKGAEERFLIDFATDSPASAARITNQIALFLDDHRQAFAYVRALMKDGDFAAAQRGMHACREFDRLWDDRLAGWEFQPEVTDEQP